MKRYEGIVNIEKNPFLTKSWIEQSHGLTPYRGKQLNYLFGKTVDEINGIEINEGKYPAFVGIRWGFAEMKNNILIQTNKWMNRIYYDDFGSSIKKRNPP